MPEGFHFLATGGDCRVARFHRCGKGKIGERVFVAAEDAGSGGECGEPFERVQQLLRRPFKQSSTASAEQGVATEQDVVDDEGDMPERVTGNFHDSKAQSGNLEVRTLADPPGHCPTGLLGPENLDAESFPKRFGAARVIAMMMRQQDGARDKAIARYARQHGRGIAGVHDDDFPLGVRRVQQPDVIVLEGGYVTDLDHGPDLNPCGSRAEPRDKVPRMDVDDRLDPWFRSPLGDALLCAEAAVTSRLLERVFGFVAVSIGGWWPSEPFMEHCAIRRRLHLDAGGGDLVSPLDNLALASDSVDAVLLPHTLEFVESPQRLLREVERVLVGEGHVLILGFNPWSTWTVRRLLKRERFPESGRPLARGRLIDWLELLGFEVLAAPGFFRRPPLDHRSALARLEALEHPDWVPLPGGVYAVLARKHVYTMTPLRPAWERRRRLIAGLASPTAHSTEWHRAPRAERQ